MSSIYNYYKELIEKVLSEGQTKYGYQIVIINQDKGNRTNHISLNSESIPEIISFLESLVVEK